MNHRLRVRRVRLHRRSDDEAGFAVRFHPRADESDLGLQDEVARELPPCELELVAIRPHFGPAGAQRVGLCDGVVSRRPREGWRADVAAILKLANWSLAPCREAGQRQQHSDESGTETCRPPDALRFVYRHRARIVARWRGWRRWRAHS